MTPLPPKSRVILVLGMHRSGTSAITGLLNLLGVELGNRLMPPAASNNESGFWEHMGVVEIHDALLHALGRNWHDLRQLPRDWLHSDAAKVAKGKLAALIKSDFAKSTLWAVKDPRLCRLLPLWCELLSELQIEPCVVMVLRHPDEVSRSLRDRDGFPLEQGLLSWLEHVADAELDSRGWLRAIVAYDDVLSGWRRPLEHLGVKLAIDWPCAPDCVADEVDTFLIRGQRHHVMDAAQTAELPGLIQDVYEAMLAITRGEDSWRNFEASVDRYHSMADIFASGFDAEIESTRSATNRLVTTIKSDAQKRGEAMLLTLQEIDARVDVTLGDAETFSHGDSATLYWCSEEPGPFDEACKVTLESAKQIGGGRLIFRLPRVPRVLRLRIDPSLHPGRFDLVGLRIDKVHVEDFAGRVGQVSQLRLSSQGPEHVALLSMNDDPYVEVAVADLPVDWSCGAVVEIYVLRQSLPNAGFDKIWERLHEGIVAAYAGTIAGLEQRSDALAAAITKQSGVHGDALTDCMRSIAGLEQRSNALAATLTEQLRAEGQASRSDMLSRLEALLRGADARHVDRHEALSRDVGCLLERVDGQTAELAELREELKVMDEERRKTLLQRMRRAFRRR